MTTPDTFSTLAQRLSDLERRVREIEEKLAPPPEQVPAEDASAERWSGWEPRRSC